MFCYQRDDAPSIRGEIGVVSYYQCIRALHARRIERTLQFFRRSHIK